MNCSSSDPFLFVGFLQTFPGESYKYRTYVRILYARVYLRIFRITLWTEYFQQEEHEN